MAGSPSGGGRDGVGDGAAPARGPSAAGVVHVFWDARMLDHDAGAGVFDSGVDPGFLEVLEKHPENADRVRNMVSILRRGPISPYISWHPGRSAHTSELLSFHTPSRCSPLFHLPPAAVVFAVRSPLRQVRVPSRSG